MCLDLLNFETLKFLMHYREPGSSFYFYSYSHFFLFSFLTFFFLFLIFFLFFFLITIVLFAPLWTLKLHCTYLLPHA
jgi:hypothetical protein